jgi:hypothetical protein
VISIAAIRTRDLEPEHVWMAAWIEDVAGQYGQVEGIERVAAAMSERVGADLLSLQWLIRGFLKACEVAESLAEDFLSQRFVSAQAMTRALLEGTVTLAWTMDEPTEREPLLRVQPVPEEQLRGALRKVTFCPSTSRRLRIARATRASTSAPMCAACSTCSIVLKTGAATPRTGRATTSSSGCPRTSCMTRSPASASSPSTRKPG